MIKNKIWNVKQKSVTYFTVFFALFIVLTIIISPKDAVEAAKSGLFTWFNIVLPSLLPFFIGSEILAGLGVVNFIGALLQPIMRPVFNVPGKGAFPFAMSITSGYPVGVKLVSKLRTEDSISTVEAQRLVSFCSTSGPLFMIGAVSIGMLNNASIGPLIAISHYLSSISIGLIFSFYKRKERVVYNRSSKKYIKNAFEELIKARQKDGRSISVLMGDAVKDGMNTMLMVGGFIILYSVIIRVLEITNILSILSSLITSLIPLSLNKEIIRATLSGVIEITNGCNLVSSVSSAQLVTKISAISLLIGWSGFSIHSQSMTMLGKTDINTKLYILAKAIHGILASLYSYILYFLVFKNYISVSSPISGSGKEYIFTPTWIGVFRFSLEMWLIITITLLLIGLSYAFISRSSRK